MSEASSTVANREGQAKFAQSRVTIVEKYYGLLCDTLGSVIRKSARLRDKGDLFSHHLKEYANAEKLNRSSSTSLVRFAENFCAVQDYRDTEIKRLEAKVLKPFMKYGTVCKNMKSTVKNNQNAWDRERKQLAKLEKLHQKLPSSDPQIASNDLQRMRQETGIYGENLISETDQFERNKIADMKAVLNEFVQIEMMFHARALKYLSECYEAVQSIDAEVDMDQFRAALLEASGLSRSFTQTGGSSTLGSSFTASGTLTSRRGEYSSNNSSSNQELHRPSPRPRRQGMYQDADDEDSDEDYDEDDDDDESDY
ncbi:protein fam92a1 [Plakobranchus ocellatus]|uniref:Protein fam92a1 n=1 Tax=Plakobranchus ocellatus TaxID=259542 RepID=A0AAV4BDD7_9GAST|nr:protein fam92a1 [Plakobranchus ocellatus]